MDSIPWHPVKGDIVDANIPLAPLRNVGRALLDEACYADLECTRVARRALMDEYFFREYILKDDSKMIEKPRDAKAFMKHIEVLAKPAADKSGLVLKELTDGRPRGYVSYFPILKEPELARAIFDGRFFNLRCFPSPKFHLGDIEILLDTLSSFGTKRVFFYSTDLVNCFYQIPLGSHLAIWMAVMAGGRSYLPQVLPMGWSWSCFIAQSLCWGVILKTKHGDKDLGIPQSVVNGEVPGRVRMNDGTFILVVYDTILCLGTDEVAVSDWKHRIKRNMDDAQLVLKYEKFGPTAEFGGLQLESTDDGIFWSVLEDTQKVWNTWAKSEVGYSAQMLWKALGYMRFVLPVLGVNLALVGQLTKVQSDFARDFKLKTKGDYLRIHPQLKDPILAATNLIENLDYKRRHPKSHLGIGWRHRRVFFVAVDATTSLESYTFFIDGLPSNNTGTRPTSQVDIMGAEAAVMAWAIGVWYEMEDRCDDDVLVIIGDNQPVTKSFYKGWSQHEGANIQIARVSEVLAKMTVLHGDIDTNDNFADIGTRPEESFTLDEQRRKAEMTSLRMTETLKNFIATRRRIFMRYKTEEDTELKDIFDFAMMNPFDDDDVDEPELKRNRIDERCNGTPHGA